MDIEPTLTVMDGEDFTKEMLQIYGIYHRRRSSISNSKERQLPEGGGAVFVMSGTLYVTGTPIREPVGFFLPGSRNTKSS